MSVQAQIETKIQSRFLPSHLEVVNESHQHAVAPGSETHFKVILVSQALEGLNRIQRHRELNSLLAEELKHPVHALSLKLYTPAEWEQLSAPPMASPHCRGGSKHS